MAAIDLYWLPLGAGGHSVRLNGLVFEAIAARLQHRDRSDLYHSALEVRVPSGRFVVEQAPAWGVSAERGVVAEGPGRNARGRPLPALPLRGALLARGRDPRYHRGRRESEAPQRGSGLCTAAARARAPGPDAGLGQGRTPCRGDVEFELR